MRILQIAACVFCLWLVFCRQEVNVRLVASLRGVCPENVDCCLRDIDPTELARVQKALMPVVQRADASVNNIEGTAIYILSASYWTELQAQQSREKLRKTVAELQRVPEVRVKLIKEESAPHQNWQLFGGIVGVLLLTVAAQIHSRRKACS